VGMDMDELDGPTNDLGPQDDNADEQATLEAKVRTMEIELEIAKMKARQATLRQKK
jgi:hypothetical protein